MSLLDHTSPVPKGPRSAWGPFVYIGVMAEGDWHQIGDYRFRETLHGPNVTRQCIDCDRVCYATPDYPTPRCGLCLDGRYHQRLKS